MSLHHYRYSNRRSLVLYDSDERRIHGENQEGVEYEESSDTYRSETGVHISGVVGKSAGNSRTQDAGAGSTAEESAPSLTEILCGLQCRLAGATFVGIQSCFGLRSDLCLFNDAHGSTLALPVSDLSADRIRTKTHESEKLWGESHAKEEAVA